MASVWDFPRNIASVTILTEVGQQYGMSVAQCLANSGIRRDLLEAPDAEIEATQELKVARNLLDTIGYDAPLGLDAGERYHPTTYGIWGLTILSSPSVRSAIEVGLRYLRLTSIFCDIRFEESGGLAHLVADDSQLPRELRQFLVERDGATMASLKRDMLPVPLMWSRLDIKHAAPHYHDRIRRLYQINPRYGQKYNRLSLSAEVLDLRMPHGFLPTLKLCEMQCRKLLERRRSRNGLAHKIRQRLNDDLRRIPTMQDMASELGIPLRTLRRRLAVDGTDYESLVEEARIAVAEELLTTIRLPISAIAQRIGYSEPSCFVRAFSRWKSMPPGRYRESLLRS
jgi:AraC-like DNA-binding protein